MKIFVSEAWLNMGGVFAVTSWSYFVEVLLNVPLNKLDRFDIYKTFFNGWQLSILNLFLGRIAEIAA